MARWLGHVARLPLETRLARKMQSSLVDAPRVKAVSSCRTRTVAPCTCEASTLFNHFHRTGLLSALALARGTAVAWLAGWAQIGSLAVCLSIVLRDHASASGSAVVQCGRLCAAFSCI